MPIDLVLVRHGRSEGNAAKRLSEAGDHSAIRKLEGRHTSSFRLDNEGRAQARLAGDYIRNKLGVFDRQYTSEYIRAMETAALLGLDHVKWFCDFYISERDWGDMDVLPEDERQEKFGKALKMRDVEPFFWRPPNGESFAQLCLRVDRLLNTLARECSDKRVIIVCHGEVMWAFRIRLERMSQVRFRKLHLSKRSEDRIHNCQIIHYTRRNPFDSLLRPYYSHSRVIRPSEQPVVEFHWQDIIRPTYTSEDLLQVVEGVERMVA